jgi:hypothetical protein
MITFCGHTEEMFNVRACDRAYTVQQVLCIEVLEVRANN